MVIWANFRKNIKSSYLLTLSLTKQYDLHKNQRQKFEMLKNMHAGDGCITRSVFIYGKLQKYAFLILVPDWLTFH
jgi:hypothetical protein